MVQSHTSHTYERVALSSDSELAPGRINHSRSSRSGTIILLLSIIAMILIFSFTQRFPHKYSFRYTERKSQIVHVDVVSNVIHHQELYVQTLHNAVIGRNGPHWGDIMNLQENITINTTETNLTYEKNVILFEHFYHWGQSCMNPGHFFIEFYFKLYAWAKFYNDTTGYKILVARLEDASEDDWCLGLIRASFEGYEIEVLERESTDLIFAEKVFWFHFGIDRTWNNWAGYRLSRYPNYAIILEQLRDDVYKYYGIEHGRPWHNYYHAGNLNIVLYTREDTGGRYLTEIDALHKYLNLTLLRKMPKRFKDQVHFFANVDVMIAASSGSNSNVLWMPKDSMYFEIEYGYREDWLLRMGHCVNIGYCIGTDHRWTNLKECENPVNRTLWDQKMAANNLQAVGKCVNVTDKLARYIATEIQRRHEPRVFPNAYNYATGYDHRVKEGPIDH